MTSFYHKLLNSKADCTWSDYIFCFVITLISFILCFYVTDWLQVGRKIHCLYFKWELNIPFLKIAFLPYFAVLLLPLLIPFYIKQRNYLYILTFRLIFSMLLASIIFWFYPTQAAFAKRDLDPLFEKVILLVAGKYNLFPSLHVCLTIIICTSMYSESKIFIRLALKIIILLLPLSTLLSHQHHLLDVIGGILLALFSIKFIKEPI